MKRDRSSRVWRHGLAETDIRDGPRSGENTNPHVSLSTEAIEGVDEINAEGDFENVRGHGGFGVAGEEEGLFGSVFGAGWAASGAAVDLDGSAVAVGFFFGSGGGGGAVGFIGGL